MGSFWEESTDETVGVFVRASLPRTVGLGKENVSLEELRSLLVHRELRTIVIGDGVNRKAFQKRNGQSVCIARVEGRKLCNSREARLAIDDGQNSRSLALWAYDRVALKVT